MEVNGSEHRVLERLPRGARVLIIRLRSMGDTVLMTPSLRLLHDWRPDLRISVLVERPWDELLENHPAVDSVIALRSKLLATFQLRRKRFDLCINLHGGPTSCFLTRASGARWKAAFQHFRNQGVYSLRVPSAQEIFGVARTVHTAEHVASCMFWLGVPFSEIPRAEVFPAPDAEARVAAKLSALGIGQREGYAVVHPAAAYATKQWTPSGFADIANYLLLEFGLRSVFICAEEESGLLGDIERHSGGAIVGAVGWPLRDVVALISGARIFIGNDSGPAHIAAASGIPVVVIFGSSHSAVWRPWTDSNAVVVQNDFDCNPCAGDRCYTYSEPRCILSITTEQVKTCVEGLLLHSAARNR